MNRQPHQQQRTAAESTAPVKEFLDSFDLEKLTGTPSSTWRFWASSGAGPASFKLGRRRVWKRSSVLAWLAEQEAAAESDAEPPVGDPLPRKRRSGHAVSASPRGP